MRFLRQFLAVAFCLGMTPVMPAAAEGLSGGLSAGLSALARLNPGGSAISTGIQDMSLDFAISQPVPWRVRLLDEPPRLVLDMREVDWTGLAAVPRQGERPDLRAGVFRPGWSRLVVMLDGPWLIMRSEMQTGDAGAKVQIRLQRATREIFARAAAQPEPPEWILPVASKLPAPQKRGSGPVVVVIDPGHGGIDPGAERDGHKEADLMLSFARELKELLLRDGGYSVVLTRDDDIFVPLEARISVARAAGAHVFLSLHADAIAEGEAQGATLYTLSEAASDAAAKALAERHERDDLLAGVDLAAQDDVVATVLMDMARTVTAPRTERLTASLETAIRGAELRMHRKPRQSGGFSVLKSPDIPSVLIELGFLSSARDLKRLTDPDWRAKMAAALAAGLRAWADEDQAISALQD